MYWTFRGGCCLFDFAYIEIGVIGKFCVSSQDVPISFLNLNRKDRLEHSGDFIVY